MSDLSTLQSNIWLIALAAPREFEAVARVLGIFEQPMKPWQLVRTANAGFDLVWTGVGKANAAGAVARVIDPDRHVGVLSAGIAGSLLSESGEHSCKLLDVVCASESIFADEGVETPDGFESCASMGFAPFENGTDSMIHDAQAVERFACLADVVGTVATVSNCAGSNSRVKAVVARTGAVAEAMEGAAVALAAKRVCPKILTSEFRVISNTTGDRDAQQWDLDGAMEKLGKIIGRIAQGA